MKNVKTRNKKLEMLPWQPTKLNQFEVVELLKLKLK